MLGSSAPWIVTLVGVALAGSCTPTTPSTDDAAADVAPDAGSADDAAMPDLTKIPIEEIAKWPAPGTSVPHKIAFSPDDKLVTFLLSPENSLVQELFAYDVEKGTRATLVQPPAGGITEDNLSLEEKLQRERKREKGLGIASYTWPKESGETLLIPLRGAIYVQDGADGTLRELVPAGEHPALDPQLSRDGSKVAFVRDAELHVLSVAGGTPLRLTQGAREAGVTHGLAEYIAQEEMGRHHGYWWSHDGRQIAFTEVDESHIPVYRIMHQARAELSFEDHRYPFAGHPNAKVRLGVVPAAGGTPQWIPLAMEGEAVGPDGTQDLYLARVGWFPNGDLAVQLENREQTRLDLVRIDPKSAKQRRLVRETSDVWINLHHDFHPLETTEKGLAGGFVWSTEESGFRHLQLHDRDGRVIRVLTKGNWQVDALVDVDEAGGQVYFLGSKDGPTSRHLYAVPLAGGDVRRITDAPGLHTVYLDHGFKRFVDVHSSKDHPPVTTLRNLADGRTVATLDDGTDKRVKALDLRPPTLVTLQTPNGVTLHGAIYQPPHGEPPYPTLVSVYGGPHAQKVVDSWSMTADLRAQYLAQLGYLVFSLDNRGSARRGLAFEGAIKNDMGNIEVQDQVTGVKWLVAQGLADPERVGIYGWSYGGYMAAMALARAPETFKLAVAGAPVTHWDGYDTHYTERYMGTPTTNPEGYEVSSVMHHVPAMTGKLLIVHGLIDENVHFRHSARLIDRLIAAGKDWDVLFFPDERHMPRREEDRVGMERAIHQFLRENL